jgi:hypothetical protein
MDVYLVCPLPTPAISFLTRNMRADLGIVISASHNPYYDNGIKFFDRYGFKLSSRAEEEISEMVLDKKRKWDYPKSQGVGRAFKIEDSPGRYIVSLKNSFPTHLTLDGVKIVLDCANGAAYRVAPLVFEELGAEVIKIGVQPNGLNINEETYFRIIQDKTASLQETCTIIGAESSSDNKEYISALHSYGNKLGIAFQIQDDILDFVGKSKLFGKTIGGDIKEKKLTLPLIHAMSVAEPDKKKKILIAIRKRKDPAMIKQVVQFVKESGGIDYAQNVANRYVNEAISALDILPDTPSKTSLKKLVHFVVGRDK